MYNNEEINKLLNSLNETKFRGSFHLNENMINYCKEKGFLKIKSDAREIIEKRLSQAEPKNDGKQTPTIRNSHPVFIAQHACGCCCRGCLERIHHIKKGKELSDKEINYIVNVLMIWIVREVRKEG